MSCVDYDTMSDVKDQIADLNSFADLYNYIFGPLTTQFFAADLITGPSTSNHGASPWGEGRSYGPSVVYIRSHPAGRLGKLLIPGELRTTSILMTCARGGKSKVTIVRAFLIDGVTPDLTGVKPNSLVRHSMGPPGVPLVGPLIFRDHTSETNRLGQSFASSRSGFHLIMPSTCTLIASNGGTKNISSGMHDFAVAQALAGVAVVDKVRRPVEEATVEAWSTMQLQSMNMLTLQLRPSFTNPAERAGDALMAAKMVCESLSCSGMLDLLTKDIGLGGGVPDDFVRPTALPLVIAMLTRIVAYPSRYELQSGAPNDMYAAAEIAAAFEANERPVVTMTQMNKLLVPEDQLKLLAIDIAINKAFFDARKNIEDSLAKASPKELHEFLLEKEIHKESMQALFRMGTSLVVDLAGPKTPALYGKFGYADKVCDAAALARSDNAAKQGLGNLGSCGAPPGQSSRADRQAKLLKILHEVEQWLRTGVYRGAQVAIPNETNPTAVRKKIWAPEEDENGFRVVPKWRHGFDLTRHAPDVCHDALGAARMQLTNLLTRGTIAFTAIFDFEVACFGKFSHIECADCPAKVSPLEAFGFGGLHAWCRNCNRPRCQSCALADDELENGGKVNCLRCV